jgi:hypothetical protein
MSPFALFAQAADNPGVLQSFLRPDVLVFCIPIAAILGGIAFAMTKAIIAHRERMAKIQQGIDPDERPGAQ